MKNFFNQLIEHYRLFWVPVDIFNLPRTIIVLEINKIQSIKIKKLKKVGLFGLEGQDRH